MILDRAAASGRLQGAIRNHPVRQHAIGRPGRFIRGLRLSDLALGGERLVLRKQCVLTPRLPKRLAPFHVAPDVARGGEPALRNLGLAGGVLRAPPSLAHQPRDVEPAQRETLIGLDQARVDRLVKRFALTRQPDGHARFDFFFSRRVQISRDVGRREPAI